MRETFFLQGPLVQLGRENGNTSKDNTRHFGHGLVSNRKSPRNFEKGRSWMYAAGQKGEGFLETGFKDGPGKLPIDVQGQLCEELG